MTFTMDNTEGYTQQELDTMNEAEEILRRDWDCEGLEQHSINDAIGNSTAAVPMTAEELAIAAAKRLGL